MDDFAFLTNASATFEDLELNGPPAQPLAFESSPRGRAERVDAPVYNPKTKIAMEVNNIIYERHADGRPPQRAYWVGRKIKKCIFGVVKECTLLKFRNDIEVPWEVTEGRAAVKIMSWQKINDLRHIEDPQQEVAAMQYISKNGVHPHVMGVYDVLEDEDYLLLFMPFCSSGDLFGFVQQAGRFPEEMARFWFKQVLSGLTHLQKMGVCHRDMSLENLLVDEYRRSIIIDLGMCLRVPYDDGDKVTDVSAGTTRRLIKQAIPCGKPNYISPEILSSDGPFDGFAIDLWASAVILFIMLVGLPPWNMASFDDPRFKLIVSGGLEQLLRSWGREISPLAANLLQRMLQMDPRRRLSLCQVLEHPWVTADDMNGNIGTEAIMAEPNEAWRNG